MSNLKGSDISIFMVLSIWLLALAGAVPFAIGMFPLIPVLICCCSSLSSATAYMVNTRLKSKPQSTQEEPYCQKCMI